MFGKFIRALVVASLLIVGQAAAPSDKAAAYNIGGHVFDDLTLTYCFVIKDAGPVGTERKNMFRKAFDKWENITGLTFTEDCGPLNNYYQIEIAEQTIHPGASSGLGPVASGGCFWWDRFGNNAQAYNGQWYPRCERAAVTIYESWFPYARYQSSNPECWMFAGTGSTSCKIDGYSVIVHEVGHAIGMYHTGPGNCNDGYLLNGAYWYYYMNQNTDSCNSVAQKVMSEYFGAEGWYWGRNQGFRVGPFDYDTKVGAQQLYGP